MASFAVGDAVDCLAAAGAAWAPYRVARVRPDRRVDLFSADGGARLHRVDPRRLRRRGTAAATTTDAPRARGPAAADATTPAAEASRDDASPRAAGRRVAVAFHGGRRRCGEVLRRGRRDERRHVVAAGAAPNARARYEVGAEGPLRFDVAYDEGGVERGVAGDRVRPLSPADDTAAAVDDAGAGTLPAEPLRARWRRRRDDAAADPAPAADDARPWPRFARCAVLLDGEWRRARRHSPSSRTAQRAKRGQGRASSAAGAGSAAASSRRRRQRARRGSAGSVPAPASSTAAAVSSAGESGRTRSPATPRSTPPSSYATSKRRGPSAPTSYRARAFGAAPAATTWRLSSRRPRRSTSPQRRRPPWNATATRRPAARGDASSRDASAAGVVASAAAGPRARGASVVVAAAVPRLRRRRGSTRWSRAPPSAEKRSTRRSGRTRATR